MDEQERLVDLNTAEPDELTSLPGVGPAMAERIVAERPFTSLEDLMRVNGIGPSLLEGITNYITISPIEIKGEKALEAEPAPEAQTEPEEDELPHELQAKPEEIEVLAEDLDDTGEAVEIKDMAIAEDETKPPVLAEAQQDESTPAGSASVEEVVEDKIPDDGTEIERDEESEVTTLQQEASPKESPQGIRPAGALGLSCLSGCLSVLISVIVILGALAMINDGLQYASYNDFLWLNNQIRELDQQAIEMQQDLLGMQDRMDNLESFTGRVTEVQGEVDRLSEDLGEVIEQSNQLVDEMQNLSAELGDLESQTMELQTNTQRFEKFLDGLRDLLFEPEEIEEP
jgi:competence ComEA-like helix-hairpin-helix protein